MIISILNTKGGAGKTTVSVNLATAFALAGFDTHLVDTDKEGTSIAWSGRRDEPLTGLTVTSLPTADSLKKNIAAIDAKHDVVVIDGAPHLMPPLTIAVVVSRLVVVPVKP